MFFSRLVSEGLSHYSYLVADDGQAVAIDPRRDCDIYIAEAARAGCRVAYVLETHRNEDYVAGSVELAARTGATVLRSNIEDLPYAYGQGIGHGHELRLGRLTLTALSTPGHTLGHLAYVLRTAEGEPWMVFSGDALFAGDVGRTDFYGPERLERMTGLLYRSLFETILPLGDQVILCPAHGPGSVCGSMIADRPLTTLGLERRLNPFLLADGPEAFIRLAGRTLPRPPYFTRMEEWNLSGAPFLCDVPAPAPMSPAELAARLDEVQVLDIRDETAFAAAHVPGSLSIWSGGLSHYAGWFLSDDTPLVLVADDVASGERAARDLSRVGFDNLEGTLSGGIHAWLAAGRSAASIDTLTVNRLCDLLDMGEKALVLDVRNPSETALRAIPGALAVPLHEAPDRLADIPVNMPVRIFCGSGSRSMVAASLLARDGRRNASVVLGGLAGWTSSACPLA